MPWSKIIDVAGVQPWEPGQFAQVPEGPYTAVIKSVVDKMAQNAQPGAFASTWFGTQITEPGEAQGMEPNVIIGGDTEKEGNKKKWRALLLSLGANVQVLDDPNRKGLNLAEDMFVGKPVYLYVSEPAPGATRTDGKPGKPFNDVVFTTREYYEQKKAELAAGGGRRATGAQLPAGGGTQQPPVFGGAAPGANGTPGASGTGLAGLAANLGPGATAGGPALFGSPGK